MNEHFVNIKVDREERPDVDHIYMSAVQMLTGRGGWPMTVFLTPDGKPFYGGTYFPPRGPPRAAGVPPRAARASRRRIATSPTTSHEDRRAADGRLRRGELAQPSARRRSTRASCTDAAAQLARAPTTPQHGGIGQAPKFPNEAVFDLFLRAARGSGAAALSRHGPAHAAADGARRHLRSARRRLPPLLGRRALAGAALREDALRQRPARAAVSVAPIRSPATRSSPASRARRSTTSCARCATRPAASTRRRTPTARARKASSSLGRRRGAAHSSAPTPRELACRYWDVTDAGNFERRNILHVTLEVEQLAKLFRRDVDDGRAAARRQRARSSSRRASSASSRGATRRC